MINTDTPLNTLNSQSKDTNFNLNVLKNDTETLINKAPEQINPNESISCNIDNLIKTCIVDITKELPPPPIAMLIKGIEKPITLFTKGNFSIVTGKAKSRKSFLISMLMASAIKGSFENQFFCPTDGTNILFDTEQSEYKVIQVAKRICKLAEIENPKNFISYHLRTLDPHERLTIIEKVLSDTPNLNFVAIDGIIDLDIDPILQAEQAQKIISKLMKWTDTYNIHIVCVLHYNKTISTLLGHLGSFAHRKADSVIEVVKDAENKDISLVNPVDCREIEFESFAFSIDSFGIPSIANDYSFSNPSKANKSEKSPKQKALQPHDLDVSIHTEILKDVFKISKEQTYNDLWHVIKQVVSSICKDKLKDSLGDNKAKDFITYYLQNEFIVKFESKKKQLYTIKEQKEIELIDASLMV